MPSFQKTDWYRHPLYYDIIFDRDTAKEADFLEAVMERHGPRRLARKCASILEPACGSGRLVVELARRGHRVTGFDAGREMIAFAHQRLTRFASATQQRARLTLARMESFSPDGRYDMAFCLISTFKYLLTERHARAHLRRIARALSPGGLYVIGLHLTDYARRKTDREFWRESRNGVSVASELVTFAPKKKRRTEAVRNRLLVRERGTRGAKRLETNWSFRTYDAAELLSLLAAVPSLEPVACYDFTYDINETRCIDDLQEDLVVVLRRVPGKA